MENGFLILPLAMCLLIRMGKKADGASILHKTDELIKK